MRILFTGASSFTGMWFARELAQAGHEVVATFRQPPEAYADAGRRQRVALAQQSCRAEIGCSFGDARFLELVRSRSWDLLCHHGADVTNYRSPDFDPLGAAQRNSANLPAVLQALRERQCSRVLLTGSVFENDEGAGSEGLPAFSPYGLSKAFTYQLFRHHAARAGLALGKFVIPNPFGPYEEPRFTSFLMKTWGEGKPAKVNTPAYVRDNIHVSLLAKAYAKFAARLPAAGLHFARPSGYAESQGAFTLRVAAAMRERLGLACEVELATQAEFAEPRIRINTEPADDGSFPWSEKAAWDEFAAFYRAAAPR
ncbi:MAG TPA: NAD(P)-dependent oxidoreductase [Burkholderiales bacterium]|nr:NAD(P)-dependent oxidoreductase [Burkholderiales bacterium]